MLAAPAPGMGVHAKSRPTETAMKIIRRAGVLLAATALALSALAGTAFAHHRHHRHAHHSGGNGGSLPVDAMQSALGAQGTVTDGVLSVGIDREDIGTVSLNGTPIKPSFEVNGSLDFQPIGNHQAFFNGDLALKPDELNKVIDAITSNGLTFQAEHQHMYDFSPMVWFIHLRGKGDPVKLAHEVHNVLKATSTPLPQSPPSKPSTPLDKGKLQKILHGYDAEVGNDGVVTVFVARRDTQTIDGVQVKPETNIATNIAFEPLSSDGSDSAVIPDFAMEAQEINGVVGTMRAMNWDIGCLYNQETDEHPQLFFSHQFKRGNPYQLAAEIRKGLDQMNSQ
jgi:Domain of Unknown Function (DUF1259)